LTYLELLCDKRDSLIEQDAEKARQRKKTVVWFVWSVWFFG